NWLPKPSRANQLSSSRTASGRCCSHVKGLCLISNSILRLIDCYASGSRLREPSRPRPIGKHCDKASIGDEFGRKVARLERPPTDRIADRQRRSRRRGSVLHGSRRSLRVAHETPWPWPPAKLFTAGRAVVAGPR